MSSPTQQQANITPDYLKILGLDRAPFLDQIEDHFFYADPALMQRLDLLQHLTRFGDMLLGITGPLGSGKTTLLRQFLLRGNNTWHSCIIQGGQIKQSGELLSRLADCFGQDMTAAPERIRADLIRYCQALQHNSQLAVVVIDDAHLLPDPVLRALLDLGGDARQTLKLLRVLLFGEPGLEQKLIDSGMHSLQQPLLHSLEIPRFDEHQTAAYLMYRLAVAGFSGDSPFSLTEIRGLHKAAEGLPGKLNVLAHETLIERANRIAARKKTTPASTPTPADTSGRRRRPGIFTVLGGVLALGAIAAIGWYQLQPGSPQDGLTNPVVEPESPLAQTPVSPEPETPPPPSQAANDVTASELRKILDAYPENEQAVDTKRDIAQKIQPLTADKAPKPSPVPDSASSQPGEPPTPVVPPATTPEPAETNLAGVSPAPADTSAKATTAIVPPIAETTSTPPAGDSTTAPSSGTTTSASAEPVAESAPISPPESASKTPVIQAEPAAGPVPAKPVATASPVTPAPVTPAPATPVAEMAGLLGEDWLLQRPAEHYTLQLLGVRSEASLQDYLKHNKLPGPIAYFHTQYKGGDWFVLVHGDYATITEARDSVAALPAGVRKAKPWPRTFATVQADIHKSAP